MRLVASIVGLVLGGIILASTGSTAHAAPAEVQSTKEKKQIIATVKAGDSLSKIAKKYDTTYVRIFYANKKIKDPDVIFAGQRIRIPEKDEKLKKRPLSTDTVAVTPTHNQEPVRRYSQAPAPQRISTAGDNVSGGVWDRLAACESGGNWHINTGNGYYGGLQFSLSSWRGVGGSGYPHQASKAEQIKRAQILKGSGGWGHWPACSAKLGLR